MARRFPEIDRKAAEQMVREVVDCMAAALAAGSRIELRGFGSFGVKLLPARIGRNPKSGIRVAVPAKPRPYFRAGKQLRERIQASAEANKLNGGS